VAEDADGRLGIAQDVLDRQREGDDRRFVMLASPQVQVTVGRFLTSQAAVEHPLVVSVGPAQSVAQQHPQAVGLGETGFAHQRIGIVALAVEDQRGDALL
jgi:hypothetical protein